jgi:hypothetical protein
MRWFNWRVAVWARLFGAGDFSGWWVETAIDAPSLREKRSLKDCRRPTPRNGGFRLDGHIVWCSSVIKVGERTVPRSAERLEGEVTALFTACMMPDERAWVVVQPVDRYVPGN